MKKIILFGILIAALFIIGCKCADSDGGINIYQKGTVTMWGKQYTDYCHPNGELIEYYCKNNSYKPVKINITCPFLGECNDGACQNATCYDTDGGLNFGVKGTATDLTGSWTDYCYGNYSNYSKVKEFYCLNGSVANFSFGYCICSDGACTDLTPECGNNLCEVGEDAVNCPVDCAG